MTSQNVFASEKFKTNICSEYDCEKKACEGWRKVEDVHQGKHIRFGLKNIVRKILQDSILEKGEDLAVYLTFRWKLVKVYSYLKKMRF